jgi:hypothetical protein
MSEYRWETNAEAGIKFELPTSWVKKPAQPDVPNALLFQAPDGTAGIEFVFVTKGALEVAADEKRMMAALQKKLTDIQETRPPSAATQNGLKVFGVAGVAKLKGVPVTWTSLAFGDGKGHGLLALMVVAQATGAAHARELERISLSVSPLTPDTPA